MKKVTKIVTLAAAAMCAFAVVGGSFAVASANQKAYAAVNATYNITYKADSAITVKGPEVAKVGSKVTVELTYNHRLYEVVSVRVGNEYAAANNDNGKSFYFVMPEEDVDVVVNSRYLGAEEDVFDIRNYNGDKGLYLDGCPGNAKAGDIVIFSISMAADAPYRFGNVVELYTDDANQDDVDFVTDGYYYMFEMPAAPVLVFTLVEAKSYFLNFDQPDLINSVTYVDNVGFAGGSEDNDYMAFDKKFNFGVRPVMVIDGSMLISDGDGSVNKPYVLEDYIKPVTKVNVNERYVGEYITYSGMLWRITKIENDGTVRIISEDTLKNNDSNLEIDYETGSSKKIYNPKQKGNIGYVINNRASEYFDTKYAVQHEIEVPIYKSTPNYGKEVETKKYTVKVSAPNMYEMFSATSGDITIKSYWLVNSSKDVNIKNAVSDIGVVMFEPGAIAYEYGIRPVIYLDKNCTVTSGKGTRTKPFMITK